MEELVAGEGGEQTRDAAEQILENTFLDGTAGDDFIGVQCYERTVLGPTGPIEPEPGTRLTQMGYEYWPQVVEYTVRRAAAYTGIPVVVTENGIATADAPNVCGWIVDLRRNTGGAMWPMFQAIRAIVGEPPTGAQAGIGARLLAGTYYGQTLQIWAALFMAALLAASLVGLIGLAERLILRQMGARP